MMENKKFPSPNDLKEVYENEMNNQTTILEKIRFNVENKMFILLWKRAKDPSGIIKMNSKEFSDEIGLWDELFDWNPTIQIAFKEYPSFCLDMKFEQSSSTYKRCIGWEFEYYCRDTIMNSLDFNDKRNRINMFFRLEEARRHSDGFYGAYEGFNKQRSSELRSLFGEECLFNTNQSGEKVGIKIPLEILLKKIDYIEEKLRFHSKPSNLFF